MAVSMEKKEEAPEPITQICYWAEIRYKSRLTANPKDPEIWMDEKVWLIFSLIPV